MDNALRGVTLAPASGHRSPAAAGILAALIVTAGGALFSRWLVDTWYPSMSGWIHGSFMLLTVGGLVSK